jgi:hypothetical protein
LLGLQEEGVADRCVDDKSRLDEQLVDDAALSVNRIPGIFRKISGSQKLKALKSCREVPSQKVGTDGFELHIGSLGFPGF